jgi:hypothetical protein
MNERLNTENAPRAVLDVDAASVWLQALVNGAPTLEFDSPSASNIALDAFWSPNDDHVDPETHLDLLEALLATACELGYLKLPDGIYAALTRTGGRTYQYVVSAPEFWGSLRLVSRPQWIDGMAPSRLKGSDAALMFLTDCVDEINEQLTSLMYSASTVLASYSSDPVLLSRLADSPDNFVRSIACQNPVTPEEARVLSALRGRQSH